MAIIKRLSITCGLSVKPCAIYVITTNNEEGQRDGEIIIPVSTTLEPQAQMKVMFRRCTNWYSKQNVATTVARLAAICHVAGVVRKHVQGNILLHQRGYAKMP